MNELKGWLNRLAGTGTDFLTDHLLKSLMFQFLVILHVVVHVRFYIEASYRALCHNVSECDVFLKSNFFALLSKFCFIDSLKTPTSTG